MIALIATAFLTLEPREYTASEFRDLLKGRDGIVVRSADRGNPAVVTGGRRISGWEVGADGVWRVTLDDVKAGKLNFSQLFVDGVRRYRPRVPEKGWYEALKPVRVEKDRSSPGYGIGGFVYAGDVMDSGWANLPDTEIQMLFRWNGARMRIAEIDESRREVIFSVPHPSVFSSHIPNNSRFAVENVKEAFGVPGQWYLDRPTGVLSYTPLPGETPGNCRVEVPCDRTLLVLDGARDIVFRNIVFRLDNRNTPADRSVFSSQGEIGTGAAVEVRESSGIVFDGCVFVNLGGWALSFDDRTSGCRVSSCVIADCGSGGIKIGSRSAAATDITVEDTEISELGRRDPGGPGIMAIKAARCRFVRNHIHHLYYTGISVGWGWRVEENPSSYGNEIARNHIHDVGMRQLSDMGLVYLLCRQPGTRIHHNHLHDIRHWGYGSTGIYPDECTAHVEIDHNFVEGCGRLLHCNMVRDLDVHDNVFIDGDTVQFDFSTAVGEEEAGIRLRRNTFVWNAGHFAQRNRSFKIPPEMRDAYRIPPFWTGLEFDENVYWRRDGERAVFPDERFSSPRGPFLDLEEFRRRSGLDGASVYRDPGPLDPLKVCGPTGVSPESRHAVWKMPAMPRPFGWDEQFVFRRASTELKTGGGISAFLGKLSRGGKATICRIGGSVTEGSRYLVPFTAWLRARYPQSEIAETVAAPGGTGSDPGPCRLERDVLRHKPDLVFVEFALNDASCGSRRISADAEGIVRGIWKADPETDIVFIYAAGRGQAESFRKGILSDEASVYDVIAERYRIPVVNFAARVSEEDKAGLLVDFFSRPMPKPPVDRSALASAAPFDLELVH